ncbi:MAG: bifunctional transaldolase/phosoglucose isomerase [Chloracidobacterium sp.]|nr:bifunctional transaldolase/phosoglucose isomerase [Chloracidobacterium sp.]MDW8217000.1 bifunctional transaldolase/phosoglucose isomerase [Acidobacteriota bacterium]
MNPLRALHEHGQSPWLDYIRRSLMTSGELQRFIDEDGLMGVTSNPAIFEKAITGSQDYTAALAALEPENLDAMTLYERLAVEDVQNAADILRPVYERTQGRDGYVSLEVSPYLARDTDGTIAEARRLWQTVNRPNLMIKVPATPEGLPAIQTLISEGVNVNVTLLFAQDVYRQVAEAYLAGLEALAAGGGDLRRVASVASFFVSRIDTLVDAKLDAKLKAGDGDRALLESLKGKVAIANAKLAYQAYKKIFSGERWERLAAAGARTQRLLWASTGTKNPQYSDVLYVEALIGPDTVNTMPPATWEAFRDHGRVQPTLESDLEAAHDTLETLEKVGISLKEVTDTLLTEAVRLFAEPFDKLLNSLDKKCKAVNWTRLNAQELHLTDAHRRLVDAELDDWKINGKGRRLWMRDARLWTGGDESRWLGWLGLIEDQLANLPTLTAAAADLRGNFQHAVVLGMGGSSLCPEVLRMTFGVLADAPVVHVLDSTDPAQISALEAQLDLERTVFIVASKSGTTLESNIFKQYFFERMKQIVGPERVGAHFVAITDPGSKLEAVAKADGFRYVFAGVPSVGGRYSALSNFGMVPAAVMGVPVGEFLDLAADMAAACSSCVPVAENPGVVLGCTLGALAKVGRDKLTFITSPKLWAMGAWLEQLIAESLGKQGKAIIPVDLEFPTDISSYGDDRVFAYLRLDDDDNDATDAAVAAFKDAGYPVIVNRLTNEMTLGQEFFRWEMATAVAGAILGVNPFDQPDVEASKVATRELTAAYEHTGALPEETPIFAADGVKLFADAANAAALGTHDNLAGYLQAHLARLSAGDYFALLAYLEMNQINKAHLQAIRHAVRDEKRVATCLGFGPRFLHSTGQAYKGGPNTGVFVQLTCDDAHDLPVPGHAYTFGVVKAAQARGDFQVLAERKRRVLWIHLGADVPAQLFKLREAFAQALASSARS